MAYAYKSARCDVPRWCPLMTHGFVQNLARPGGNATGFTIMEPTTTGKWLELLKEVAPRSNRAALLFNQATAPYASIYLNPFKAAAASLGLEPIAATVHDRAELDTVIAAQAREPNRGLIVIPDGFLNVHRADIIALAARYRLPTIYPWRFFAEEGGLLSYGSEQRDFFSACCVLCGPHPQGREAGRPASAGADRV
ncbi:MAG: ABC transporter substrate binding protein [Pseudolabrys sp.]